MNKYLLKFCFIFLVAVSFQINALTIGNQDVPERVFTYINKKHPHAQDFSVEKTTHFGRPFYEVSFKERTLDDNNQNHVEEYIELFRLDGHFYTNVLSLDRNSFQLFSSEVTKSLQSNYPGYEIQTMRSITNPNGVGQEYEIELLFSGETLNISIDDKGILLSETPQKSDQFVY